MLLKIGEFSRISQVSVKTLRYYDEIGLLKPAGVDRFTDYRFYSLDQLPRLNRILALKELGLSLEQIGRVLEDMLSTQEIRGMLRLRQAQLADQVQEMQAQLAQVEARLKYIEQEGQMSLYDVVLKTVPAVLVASRRVTIPDDAPFVVTSAFEEVINYIESQRAKITGPGISIWYTPVYTNINQEAEAAIPVDRGLAGNEHVVVHELPGVYVASVVYHGNWDGFGQAYQAILKWIEANGYHIAGPFREVYHEYYPDNTKDSTTDIQFPVEKI